MHGFFVFHADVECLCPRWKLVKTCDWSRRFVEPTTAVLNFQLQFSDDLRLA